MHGGLLGRHTKAFSALKAESLTLIECLHSKMLLLRGFLALFCALSAALALTGTAAGADPPRVPAVEFENDIHPGTADHPAGAIDEAEEDGYDAVVILMDTPGGLDSSMRDIIKKELA